MNARRRWQTGGVTVLALLVVSIAVVALRSSSSDTGLPSDGPVPGAAAIAADYAGIAQRGTTLGAAGAPSRLVVYADPQCPFCGAFERKALPDLVRGEVRAGRLRVELRLLTFIGPESERAARTLLAAGLQDRLWPLAALMARYQPGENSGAIDTTYLRRLTGAVPGLDAARVARDASSARVTAALAAAKRAAAADHVRSTPWLLAGPAGGPPRRIDTRKPSAGDVRAALR